MIAGFHTFDGYGIHRYFPDRCRKKAQTFMAKLLEPVDQRIRGKPIFPVTTHHIIRIHDMEIQTREILKELNVELKAWVFESWKVIQHKNGLNPDVL